MPENRDVISLFSSGGIGDLAIKKMGLKIVLSNEIEATRHKLFNENFKDVKCFSADIWQCQNEIISYYNALRNNISPFLIYATPPCQGMSSNGIGRLKWEIEQGNRDKEDHRNRLIIPTMNIIEKLNPEWVLFENVPGMKYTTIRDEHNNNVNIIDYISKRLGQDYDGGPEVLACEDYGIPQTRKRLITIFTRNPKGKKYYRENFLSFFPKSEKSKKVTLREAISHLPILQAKEGENSRADYHPLHFVPVMSPEKYWWVSNTKEGDQAYNNQCVECGYSKNQKHYDQNIDGKSVSNKNTPIYCQKCNSLLPRPSMIDKKSGKRRLIKGFHSAYRRMSWDKPANSLTQNFMFEASDNKIHPEQNRVLSIYEALIIQTIDQYNYSFTIDGVLIPKSKIAEIIGESVPPKLIELIIAKILNISKSKAIAKQSQAVQTS